MKRSQRTMDDWWRGALPAALAVSLFAATSPGADAQKTPDRPPAAAGEVDLGQKELLAASGLFNRGLFPAAAEAYDAFLKKRPNHPDATAARYALAICNYRLNKYEPAAELLGVVLKDPKFEQRDEALAVIGHAQLSAGKHDAALAAFDELLAKHPKSKHAEVAGLNRAQVLYLANRYADAATAAEAFAKRFPDSAERPAATYFLALSQRAQEQNDPAIATLKDLLAKHPKSRYEVDATLLLGQTLEAQGKLDDAAAQYRNMLAIAPAARQGDARYSLGVALFKAGKYDEAAREFAAVAGGAEGAYAKVARLQLGLAQLAAGKTAEARKALSAVAAEDPARAAEANYGLAQCDIAEGKFAPAKEKLDGLLKLAPPPANAQQVAFDRALCLGELGKHEEAAADFAAYVAKNPKSPQATEATYRRAFSLHKLGKYDQSHALCEQVAKVGPSPLAGPAAELDAENLFLLAKYEDAAKAYTALSGTAKNAGAKRRFALRLGQCAYFAGDYARAVERLQPLTDDAEVAANADLSRGIFLLGDALLQQKKYPEASAALKKYADATKSAAGDAVKAERQEAQFKLGLSQLGSDQAEAAGKTFAAVGAGPADSQWTVRALFEAGQLAYKQQPPKLDQASSALGKVLAFNGGNPPADLAAGATYLLGWIDLENKKYDAAAERWQTVTTKFEKSSVAPDAAFQRGVALRLAGKDEDALAAFSAYVKTYPGDQQVAKAKQSAAACLTALKRDDEAKTLLASLAADKATAGDAVLYDLAWAQKATKDDAGAQATYRRLIKEHAGSKLAPAARTELSEFLYNEKKYAEAAELLEAVATDVNADPKTLAAAGYRLGWCYEKLGQHEKAAAAFGRFAEGDRARGNEDLAASALLQAGIAYAAGGKYDDAAKALSTALQKYPTHKQASAALLKLGEVQADAGLFDESLATHAKFQEKHAADPFAHRAQFGIGWALENQKKYPQAREAYAKVIAANNGETAARAQFQMGETLLAEGKFDAAIPALLAVEDVYAYPKWSARALLEAGRAFEELKQMEQARQQYGAVVSKYKDAPEAALAQDRLKALKGGA